MSSAEPRTVVENWAHLRGRHLLEEPGQPPTLLVERASLVDSVESSKRPAASAFLRPAMQEPVRRARFIGRWSERSLSRRESAGLVLVLVALLAVSFGNRTAAEGTPEWDAVTSRAPRASERTAQQAVVLRLQDARQRREARVAQDERAVAELVQEQRERLIAARAKEEAMAQLRGRRPDPELLARLRQSSRAELEERASAVLAAGETAEALRLYRAIQATSPGSTVYAAFVRALERRLQCEPGLDGSGEPCF